MNDKQKFPERYRGIDGRYDHMSLGTKCIHAGENTGPVEAIPSVAPLYSASTYYYEDCAELEKLLDGERAGYAYTRWGSPTNAALEMLISTLIGGGHTLTTATGMAANFVALQAAGANSGKKLLVSKAVYGNVYDIVRNAFEPAGVSCIFSDFTDLTVLQEVIDKEKPDLVFFEVLTNPMLMVIDAPKVIAMAHGAGAKVIIDNTFATPYLYQPLLDGADYVTHSLTKYMNGHGDAMGGSITCQESNFENLEYLLCTQGATLSPENARMIMRGLKTFSLRMSRHCSNANQLAAFLDQHPAADHVRFPGLESDPAHQLASTLFRPDHFGGMICFDVLNGNKQSCFELINSLHLAIPAGSLGDVSTLVVHPSSTTHHSLSVAEKAAVGITEATIRVSVGIEDVEDLIGDFKQALTRVSE